MTPDIRISHTLSQWAFTMNLLRSFTSIHNHGSLYLSIIWSYFVDWRIILTWINIGFFWFIATLLANIWRPVVSTRRWLLLNRWLASSHLISKTNMNCDLSLASCYQSHLRFFSIFSIVEFWPLLFYNYIFYINEPMQGTCEVFSSSRRK
jgi:hypothetical protein